MCTYTLSTCADKGNFAFLLLQDDFKISIAKQISAVLGGFLVLGCAQNLGWPLRILIGTSSGLGMGYFGYSRESLDQSGNTWSIACCLELLGWALDPALLSFPLLPAALWLHDLKAQPSTHHDSNHAGSERIGFCILMTAYRLDLAVWNLCQGGNKLPRHRARIERGWMLSKTLHLFNIQLKSKAVDNFATPSPCQNPKSPIMFPCECIAA